MEMLFGDTLLLGITNEQNIEALGGTKKSSLKSCHLLNPDLYPFETLEKKVSNMEIDIHFVLFLKTY